MRVQRTVRSVLSAAAGLLLVLGVCSAARADIAARAIRDRDTRNKVTIAARGWLADAWRRTNPAAAPIQVARIKVTRALETNLNYQGPYLDTGLRPIPARYSRDDQYNKDGGFQVFFRFLDAGRPVTGYVMFPWASLEKASKNPLATPRGALVVRDGKKQTQLDVPR